MPYVFRTPTVSEGPIGEHRLFQFYEQDRGVTVVAVDGGFYEVRYPSEDELRAADAYWIGGMVHEVDDFWGEKLLDAGYDVTVIT